VEPATPAHGFARLRAEGPTDQAPRYHRVTFEGGSQKVIDEIVEKAVPWGIFIGLGALIGAAFPRETRQATKRVMLTGFRAADWLSGFGAEAFEKGQDVVAEARLEYEQLMREAQREAERGRLRVVPPPRRRTGARSNGHGTRRARRQRSATADTT
jgi:hypothetical protein